MGGIIEGPVVTYIEALGGGIYGEPVAAPAWAAQPPAAPVARRVVPKGRHDLTVGFGALAAELLPAEPWQPARREGDCSDLAPYGRLADAAAHVAVLESVANLGGGGPSAAEQQRLAYVGDGVLQPQPGDAAALAGLDVLNTAERTGML